MLKLRGKPGGRRAFTLVELLVVIAIIGLLMAILLPSLREFKEHARTVACQSHMGTIGKSLISYALDLDAFPITSDESGIPVSWRYGGWSGENSMRWKMLLGGAYYVPTQDRPLSAYMYPRTQLSEATPLPMFRCPSDVRSFRGGVGGASGGDLPAYDDIGTSYHLNWQWFESQTHLPNVPFMENRAVRRVERGQRIWWKYMERHAARFVTLLEDPAQFALSSDPRIQVEGNHRKFSKHNFAFLDGHAEFLHADTRQLYERNWTVVDEAPPYKEWRPN